MEPTIAEREAGKQIGSSGARRGPELAPNASYSGSPQEHNKTAETWEPKENQLCPNCISEPSKRHWVFILPFLIIFGNC